MYMYDIMKFCSFYSIYVVNQYGVNQFYHCTSCTHFKQVLNLIACGSYAFAGTKLIITNFVKLQCFFIKIIYSRSGIQVTR